MARLLADENFPLPVVEELRRLGHDVVTMLQAGMANQQIPDDVLLAYATSENRAYLESATLRSIAQIGSEPCGHHRMHVRSRLRQTG